MKELNNGVGICQLLNSSIITDIISSSGFDYTLLDLEHGLILIQYRIVFYHLNPQN